MPLAPRRPPPGGRAQPLRGPRGGPARGHVGNGVRRPLEHQGRPRGVPRPGLRARAGRPGAEPLRPGLGAHPAGRRALCGHRGCARALRPCRLGTPQLPAPGGRERGLRRYPGSPATPGPPWGLPKASPFLSSPNIPKVRIHQPEVCQVGQGPRF